MEAEPVSELFQVPPPEVIRRTAEEVIRRPDYDLTASSGDYGSLIERMLKLLRKLLRPFTEAFDALHAASPFLAWLLFVVLLLVLVALVVHIAYTFKTALQGRRALARPPEVEDRAATLPATWEEKARAAAAEGDYLGAIRHLFRACLLRLEAARKGTFRRGATNREYLRRFAETAAVEPLRLFVDTIDRWYGGGRSSREDYELCVEAHSAVGRTARELAVTDKLRLARVQLDRDA